MIPSACEPPSERRRLNTNVVARCAVIKVLVPRTSTNWIRRRPVPTCLVYTTIVGFEVQEHRFLEMLQTGSSKLSNDNEKDLSVVRLQVAKACWAYTPCTIFTLQNRTSGRSLRPPRHNITISVPMVTSEHSSRTLWCRTEQETKCSESIAQREGIVQGIEHNNIQRPSLKARRTTRTSPALSS